MKFISIENGSSFWYFVPKWKVKNSERNQENQHCLHENEINKFCQMHHFFTGLLKWESVNVVDLAQIRPRQSKEKRTQDTQPPACPPLLCLHHQVVSMMARPKVIFSLNNNNNVIKAINSSSVQPLLWKVILPLVPFCKIIAINHPQLTVGKINESRRIKLNK